MIQIQYTPFFPPFPAPSMMYLGSFETSREQRDVYRDADSIYTTANCEIYGHTSLHNIKGGGWPKEWKKILLQLLQRSNTVSLPIRRFVL